MSPLARTAILQAATGKVLIDILGVERRYVTSYFQRVGIVAWYGPIDGRQRNAKYAIRCTWPDRKFRYIRNVGGYFCIFHWFSWRFPHGPKPDPQGWARSGLCRIGLPYFGGNDPLSHTC